MKALVDRRNRTSVELKPCIDYLLNFVIVKTKSNQGGIEIVLVKAYQEGRDMTKSNQCGIETFIGSLILRN